MQPGATSTPPGAVSWTKSSGSTSAETRRTLPSWGSRRAHRPVRAGCHARHPPLAPTGRRVYRRRRQHRCTEPGPWPTTLSAATSTPSSPVPRTSATSSTTWPPTAPTRSRPSSSGCGTTMVPAGSTSKRPMPVKAYVGEPGDSFSTSEEIEMVTLDARVESAGSRAAGLHQARHRGRRAPTPWPEPGARLPASAWRCWIEWNPPALSRQHDYDFWRLFADLWRHAPVVSLRPRRRNHGVDPIPVPGVAGAHAQGLRRSRVPLQRGGSWTRDGLAELARSLKRNSVPRSHLQPPSSSPIAPLHARAPVPGDLRGRTAPHGARGTPLRPRPDR